LASMVERLLRGFDRGERIRLAACYGAVALIHVVGWGALLTYGVGHPAFLGLGGLAYTFGLRHAFDADHISAIDNTTRKLMADGKRPLSVGFFFSLGHSTVVFVLAILLNFGIRRLGSQVQNANSGLHQVTTVIGTSVSGFFLYLIAALNVVILVSIVRVFSDMRRGKYDDEELEEHLNNRGLMNRFFGGFARRIDEPWKIYPVGVLFGLGFDTATEIALLVLAGSAVMSGLPISAILSLPILFAAGMCLLDTIDGCFMNFAYGWAFARPIRKVYYNMTITGLSVAVAFIIGTIEIFGLLATELRLRGAFWDTMANFNINRAGFIIAALFVVTWVVALAIWRFGHIEARWDEAAEQARAIDAERSSVEAAAAAKLDRALEGIDAFVHPALVEAD